MEKTDIVIAGAGVIGLAIASEISAKKSDVYLVERHESFGQEISSRNSEVIHAGLYYPKYSLKAKTCVEGNMLLYELCEKNNIPFKKTGKLVVATDKTQLTSLEALYENGRNNDVKDIELINKAKIKKLEPNIEAVAAIHSKSTGIIDTHSLMKYYAARAKESGVCISYNTKIKKVNKVSSGYEVIVLDQNKEEFVFTAKVFVNCTGLESDSFAQMVGIDVKAQGYVLKYNKGQYFSVSSDKSGLMNRLVYPLPGNNGSSLGIHATPNLSGLVRLGPDDEYIEKSNINYDVNMNARKKFYESVKGYLPFLSEGDLLPDTAGIRPKLQGKNEPFRDFVIKDEAGLGFPGFINLIGIESPGLTAAPSIAKQVCSLIVKNFV